LPQRVIVAREVSRTSIASRSVDAESSSLAMLMRLVLSVTSRIAPTLALTPLSACAAVRIVA